MKRIFYWVATGLIVLESAAGSEWDLVRTAFVRGIFDRLGYPYYLLTILGVWKVLAVVALLAPRYPRVKEWAYTGLFLVYSGAAASHLFAGDTAGAWGPLGLALITVASWALRPASRRLSEGASGVPGAVGVPGAEPAVSGAARRAHWSYWVITALLALIFISGGGAQLARVKDNVDGFVRLGYPVYFLSIVGFWKVLGGLCVILPRLRVPKEWAYAGIVFAMSGAAVSNAVSGMPWWHVLVNLIILGLGVASWALRPASRRIG
jgi:uncharacterized membrane protein YphA (DoxX/SURF4 family)